MTSPRQQPESFRARSLSNSLTVNNLEASMKFYTQALGFHVGRRIERDGKLHGVALAAGSIGIILNQDDGKKGANRPKGQGFSLFFTTAQNIDELADRVKSKGYALAVEPNDTPWGGRVFKVQDPDGFLLVFGEAR